MNDSSHSPNFTSFLFRSLSSPHVRRFFGKVAIRPFIPTRSLVLSSYPPSFFLQRPGGMFDHTPSVHPLSLPPFTITASPFPINTSFGRLFFHFPRLSTIYQTNPLVITRPIWCLVPALALPLPACVCLSLPLCSIPLLYISSPPSDRPFGVASRHLSRQRDKIGSSAGHTTGHSHCCGVTGSSPSTCTMSG